MTAQHVLPIQTESFVLLVKSLKQHINDADIFEIWLDRMKVKGDLAVIQKHFNKPMIAKSESLDLLKRGAKANMTYVDLPHDLEVDLEFSTLAKNKGTKIIRSYHNYEHTPSYDMLLYVISKMHATNPDLIKISTHVNNDEDVEKLLRLLSEPRYKNRLVVTGMGDRAREVRIKAPILGSVFYYAPIFQEYSSAPGQLTKAELEDEWNML